MANPPNPWLTTSVEYLGEPPDAELHVYEEEARSVLSQNDSPDVPFRYSVNPYRGCFHACAYSYARPSHELLGFGAGTDFDRRLVVKTNAPELLETAFRRRSWRRELVAFSGVTDCYQPLEASYGLTRRCLRVCLRYHNPVAVVTKGALVERDADLLAALHAQAGARVFVSIPFADDDLARRIEPNAAPPSRRLRSLAALSAAGVPTGVALAPLIPGLNDDQIPRVLAAARDAGARAAFTVLLRLPGAVAEVFAARLAEAVPERASRVRKALAETRGPGASAWRFGERMRGSGPRWSILEQQFDLHCRRLGLAQRGWADPPRRRPVQGELFGPA